MNENKDLNNIEKVDDNLEIIEVNESQEETKDKNTNDNIVKEVTNKVKGGLKKYKKIIISVIALAVIGSGIAAGVAYKTIKASEVYTLEQAQSIALEQVKGGTVIKAEKELDDLNVEYEFKIKDSENILQEVKVDAKTGTILELENKSIKKHDIDKHSKDHHSDDNNNSIDNKTIEK